MHPYLFGTVRAYPVSMGVAVVGASLIIVWLLRQGGVPLRRAAAFQVALAAIGLFGGKIHSLFERDALHLLGWGAFLQDGFRYPGALLAALVSIPILRRVFLPNLRLAQLADMVAIAIPFALVPMRIGCFLYGCCYGVVSTVPWALRFPAYSPAANYHLSEGLIADGAASLPVHPMQLYLALLALGMAVVLLWYRKHKTFDGQLLLLFLALHEGGKFSIEFLRTAEIYQQGRFIQSASLVLCLIGLSALMLASLRRGGAPEPERQPH